jgi:hypothetical protein
MTGCPLCRRTHRPGRLSLPLSAITICVALTSLTAAGCGGTSASTSPAATAAAPATQAPVAAQTQTSQGSTPTAPVFSGEAGVSDGANYMYSFDYTLSIEGAPSKTVAHEAPGYAAIELPVKATVKITNTTGEGRVAPGFTSLLTFVELFRSSRTICNINQSPASFYLKTVALKQPAGRYCMLVIYQEAAPESSGGLQPNAAAEYGGVDLGTPGSRPEGQSTVLSTVKESDYGAVAADITKPDIYALMMAEAPGGKIEAACTSSEGGTPDVIVIASRPSPVTCSA